MAEIDNLLQNEFRGWTADPVEDDGEVRAFKYYGYSPQASDKIRGEYQVVPMLTGLFWEVEHSAIYKPDARLSGIGEHFGMQQRTRDVVKALKAFEEQFEALAS